MKIKKGILALALLAAVISRPPAYAVIMPDPAAQAAEEADDESPDASSRFGADTNASKRNHLAVAIPLKPIDESSFEQAVSRGPASTRGPASVKKKAATAATHKIIKQVKAARAYQEVALIANDLGFFPSTLFLTLGIPVRLFVTGASAKSQCFMLDQFGVRRQVRNQKIEEITFTPDQSGTFSFTCPMNGSKGVVVVKELDVGIRVPASLSVSRANLECDDEICKAKKPEILEHDFTPEFRND